MRRAAGGVQFLGDIVAKRVECHEKDIVGTRPKTITKHLEHVFEKLGVETRTAAASRVLGTMPELMRKR